MTVIVIKICCNRAEGIVGGRTREPVGRPSYISGLAAMPAKGNPLAMPLAKSMMSGTTPLKCSCAHHLPVLATPDCTYIHQQPAQKEVIIMTHHHHDSSDVFIQFAKKNMRCDLLCRLDMNISGIVQKSLLLTWHLDFL